MTDLRLGRPRTDPELSRFSLPTLARFYRERFAVAVSANLAYRGAVAIWIFVTLIQPLVFIVVWRTVAGSGETGGYTADQFVAYFLVMMVVDHLTFIWRHVGVRVADPYRRVLTAPDAPDPPDPQRRLREPGLQDAWPRRRAARRGAARRGLRR